MDDALLPPCTGGGRESGVVRFLASSAAANRVGVIVGGVLEAWCWPGGADADRGRRERLTLIQLLLGLKHRALDGLGDPG